jgi:hypothetical protein
MRLKAVVLVLIGAALLAPIGCGSGSSAVSSCATTATPDLAASGAFDVDTGLGAGAVQGNYGQPSCPGRYLVDVDLTAAPFQAHTTLEVSGIWSSVLPEQPCDETASMNVFVLGSNGAWQAFDQVLYVGQLSQNVCEPVVQSRTDVDSGRVDVTSISLTSGFTRARIAVSASEGTTIVPVAVTGQII